MFLRAASGAAGDVTKMPKKKARTDDVDINADQIEELNFFAPSR